MIAYGCLGQALKYADSNKVSVIITLNPLLTLVCIAALSKSGVSWVQAEPLSHVGYIGALIIVMGSIIVLKKPTIKRARQLGFNRTV